MVELVAEGASSFSLETTWKSNDIIYVIFKIGERPGANLGWENTSKMHVYYGRGG